ncbi:hypothetical protein Trydic_g17434 [Trypoxylus dichotomus]
MEKSDDIKYYQWIQDYGNYLFDDDILPVEAFASSLPTHRPEALKLTQITIQMTTSLSKVLPAPDLLKSKNTSRLYFSKEQEYRGIYISDHNPGSTLFVKELTQDSMKTATFLGQAAMSFDTAHLISAS